MISLAEIKKPIEENLKQFDELFEATMHSDSLLLNKIVGYILKSKGKQLRPVLVMLSAGMFGKIGSSSYTAASLIELLHTASLVHDDVVDEANLRRGFFSINARWKNKVAVLVGDYLLSRGMMLALEKSEYKILHLVSDAVKEMSEGELLQIQKSRRMNITEEVYYNIIRKKTASLIAACCASGVASVSEDKEHIEKMKQFGQLVGLAFQIKDDLLDYDPDNRTGKSAQNDLKQQKISLPLIYTLQKVDYLEKRKLLSFVKNRGKDKKKVKVLIDRIQSMEGFAYAEKRMIEFRDQALAILSGFPDSEYRKSLEQLVLFTTDRKY